jgi:hypothetical protein
MTDQALLDRLKTALAGLRKLTFQELSAALESRRHGGGDPPVGG